MAIEGGGDNLALSQHAASSQQSTQPTQDSLQSQQLDNLDPRIWCSLIPCNSADPHLRRMDFESPQTKYTIGRGSRKPDAIECDFTFPALLEISRAHCEIEWNGDDSPVTSEVVLTNLETTFGTWVRDEWIPSRESKLLNDFDVISFGPRNSAPGKQTAKNHGFLVRIWHMDRSRTGARSMLHAKYDVSDQELGQGSYATVYKALHRTEKRWYAVKLLPGGRARDVTRLSYAHGDGRRTRHLEHEIAVLTHLRHPHIVRLKEHFVEDAGISVVLELVSGGNLQSYLDGRPDPLFEHEAQRLAFQICDALAYMHRMRIVHRDLKPHNVLLTQERPPTVKVADFGMSKILDSLTVLQTRCGTPLFLAPEVLSKASEGYSKVVDSWSLGVMVFVMLTREDPFYDESRRSIDWDKLCEYNLSEDGHAFLRRLLEYNPRVRMTAHSAFFAPWLSDERARHPEALSRHHSSTTVPRSEPAQRLGPSTSPPGGGPSPRKRKHAADRLSGTLSALSINEEQPRPAKRLRVPSDTSNLAAVEGPQLRGITKRVRKAGNLKDGSKVRSTSGAARPTVIPRFHLCPSPNMDEVPGLGGWRSPRR
ncbi:kinase-like domain-containing protein [Daedaleopsis nitida]|nr:kinase-like domain-containing protein [Daedaleopsis nitida]